MHYVVALFPGEMKISTMKIGTDMKYNYLILALAAAALCSCSGNLVETPVNDGEIITIRAYQEGATETRTTLIDGGTQVYWEPSDEIKVFFRGSGSRFVSQNTEKTDIAEFSGTLNVVVGVNEGAYGSNTLWGLYPYRADAASDGESVTTTLPTEQTGRVGSFAKGTNITLAKSNSFDLAFYNVTGGIRFSLTQEGVKEVVFQGQNDEDIAGKVKLAFANGVPAVQEIIDGQKCITLTAPDGGTFETGKWYYIVALPGTLSNGFKMTFNTETQYATLTSSGSKTIKRGIFGSLADADEDLIYKDKGDEPPVTGNIVFADPAAKYACVTKYDTDGDGEVSIEEAEAVTSFDGLFTNWKGVVSFDEIRFFKNVHSLDWVFYGCDKLVSITIPENITDLGTNAFNGCSSLTSVVLPLGISAIGNYSFQNCSLLRSIDIPASVTSVGPGAFSGCSSLTSVVLPSGVTDIANYAFQNCSMLSSVGLPSGVTSVGSYAFKGCSSLGSIDLPSNLKTIGQYTFSGCSSLTQIVIPDGVTSLGGGVFSGCKSLASVILPSSITSIPDSCFENCVAMTSISIPEGVTSIESRAFSAVGIKWNLELPSSISSLGSKCFGSIICVILPSTSPVAIQSDTFYGVQRIFVPSSMIDMYEIMTNWDNSTSKLRAIDSFKEKDEFVLATSGAVDMGTSVKWAAYNVGATKPEEYGDYYAWGEIETKSTYTWSTYLDSPSRDGKSFSTYYVGEGGMTTLNPEDDVAHVKWGGSWRMPTNEEWEELARVCVWEWMNSDGKNGSILYCFETGNSIYLPLAGVMNNTNLNDEGMMGSCWTSSLETGNPSKARGVNFNSGGGSWAFNRYLGLTIRPVCD